MTNTNDQVPMANDHNTITINRAPVLTLWAASVCQVIHPQLQWDTCLSAGQAVATICAVSKGRAIGMIGEPSDDPEAQDEKKRKEKDKTKDLERIKVFSFSLPIKDGLVQLSAKPKPANEDGLKRRYGEDQYTATKKAFWEVAHSWRGEEEELQEKGFGFYEKFRPTIGTGQSSWGRSGQLDLDNFKKVARRVEEGQQKIEDVVG